MRIFGSVARGEADSSADIDLLVDFGPDARVGLLDLMRVKEVMEDLLRRRVDVMTEGALKARCAARFWPTRWT
ncbi:nucleotidyltransferase family protein [Deinococcus malanensis]|uniref:nucleotidyltransferase family protein n=1 Tax=Deinococcus malanensis TaxID=1706855 RepID=UPI00362D7AB5